MTQRAAARCRRLATLGGMALIAAQLATTGAGAQTKPLDLDQAKAERDAADDAARQSQESAAAARIRAELLAKDQTALSEELGRIGRQIIERETALAEAKADLDRLRRDIAGAQARLLDHRAALQRLLSRIQRAAREPTPSLVIQPDRPVAAARSAMLLGALSRQAEAARRSAEAEIARVAAATSQASMVEVEAREELASLRRDEAEARNLLEAKRAARQVAAATAGSEAAEADQLANRARQLADEVAALATRPKRGPKPEIGRRESERQPQEERAAAPARRTKRPPKPAVDYGRKFSDSHGALIRPVAGRVRKVDRGAMRGLIYDAAPYARVVSPWSGLVLYPKQITSSGKIVIIEPQKGFQLLLFGLSSIDVQAGDRVSPGEPIGRMGGPPPKSDEFLLEMTAENDAAPERLYFEIHARGEPVDADLWMESSTRKVSGL